MLVIFSKCVTVGNHSIEVLFPVTMSSNMCDRKDLGHLWLGDIRMLGQLQLSAHRPNFERL